MRLRTAIVLWSILASVPLIGQLIEERPIKCGWSVEPDLFRPGPVTISARPIRHAMYLSPTGAFAVHYDTAGVQAPDLVSTQVSGVPDWVVEVAAALDSARNLLLAMGFQSHPTDDVEGIYDVYIVNYEYEPSQYYGVTIPESSLPGNRYTSYLKMDNDFSPEEGYLTTGLDAARITIAHEYFHAVQLGYGWREGDRYFYEISSTWFEDVAFPEVNDWVYYFDSFANKPYWPMDQTLDYQDGYHLAIFAHYLTETFSESIIRQIWDRFALLTSAIDAIEDRVASYGSSLTCAWTDFVTRLFANGRYPANPENYFYADQNLLPAPDPGSAEVVVDNMVLPFNYLRPGKAGIQALEVETATGLYLNIKEAPQDFAVRLTRLGDDYHVYEVETGRWFSIGVGSDNELILVVGSERDSVIVDARISALQLAVNSVFPNPLLPNEHESLSVEYIVAELVPVGDHQVVIFDLLGREIFRQQLAPPDLGQISTLSLPIYRLNTLSSGVYFLRLTVGPAASNSHAFTIVK